MSANEYMETVFLLTPLREGRQLTPSLFHALKLISTHAPAGGATYRDIIRP